MSWTEAWVSPARAWATLAAFSLLFFIELAGSFSSLGMVLPSMVKELNWDWSEAGLGYTFLGLTCGLGTLVPAVLIRQAGVRATVLTGAGLLAAGFLALALTRSVVVYLVATASVGMGFAVAGNVPGTHVLNAMFRKRSTALGIYFTIGASGGVAGPLIYLLSNGIAHNWRAHWIVFLSAALLAGAFAAVVIPSKLGSPEADQAGDANPVAGPARDWGFRAAMRTPQFAIIVGAYTMYLLVHTTAHSFAPAHLIQRGFSSGTAGAMLSLESLIGSAMSGVAGALGERVDARKIMIASMLGMVVGIACLAYADNYALIVAYVLGSGIGNGLCIVAATLLLLGYFGRRANLEIYSAMHMISTLAVLGPLIAGMARDRLGNFTSGFVVMAAMMAVMGVASYLMRPPAAAPISSVKAEPEPALSV